ncbi:MAG: GatB/YqeY domain-containing protein [Chloroflexi bacterium]|nr:GatB/YqeY domain-containing protein [Chloroflexota bacterium]
MSLEDALADALQLAMRSGETVRRDTIRQLRAALHNEAIARGRALDDVESTAVVRRLVNQHKDSIVEFERGNRPDLVIREVAELEVLADYLPPVLSREEIVIAAQTAVEATGAKSKQDIGKVMRELSGEFKGRADMRLVNEVVLELLS